MVYFRLGHASAMFHELPHFVVLRVRHVILRREGRGGYGFGMQISRYLYGQLGLLYRRRGLSKQGPGSDVWAFPFVHLLFDLLPSRFATYAHAADGSLSH
jgi:hypothetical protein